MLAIVFALLISSSPAFLALLASFLAFLAFVHERSHLLPLLCIPSYQYPMPLHGTIDQKMEYVITRMDHVVSQMEVVMSRLSELNKSMAVMQGQLRYLSACVASICASGLGLLMWYIKGSIEAKGL
ncbi:hypothetical protein H072_867 [Dactylellina haptotyla CBS 200.50]|uniref:Uncharacterized protein n=1 Tax=Dactylellina haptotyla (strain CBS 200.50) TaxID=1284197 RepID=S8AQ90_DACHA|nr:hypothetical protein H072_867 [Dactylellina haptotyla CBS 200.50]